MNQVRTPLRKLAISAVVALVAVACAHKLDPVKLPVTANPIEELEKLATDLDSARSRQVDVMAPQNFERAHDYFLQAKSRRDDEQSAQEILRSIGQARAYLNESEKVAKLTDRELHEAVVARQMALTAGARAIPNELAEADRKFRRAAERLEDGKGLDIQTRTGLHSTYLDLELNAIKAAKLSDAQAMLVAAEKRGAKRLIPNTYWTTVQRVSAAEKAIDTDRRNSAVVDKASADATAAAKYLVSVLDQALAAKDKDTESLALELDSKNRTIASETERLRQVASAAQNREKTLGQMQDQVEDLQAVARLDKMMKQAQSQFTQQEAEVYRQGNNLLLRLKAMNFPIGMAEIPNDSLSTLRKVKELVKANASEVIVQGHTDAVGSANLNKRLSEERADTVAKYLVDEQAIPEDHVRSVGYGFERPIASNKSRDGRKQNRRVDIVIRAMGDTTTRTE